MRRTIALAALLLLPLAFLSFREAGLKPVAYSPDAGAEGSTELSSAVGARIPQSRTISGMACIVLDGEKRPLDGAVVSVVGTGLSTLSGGNGHFSFSLLPGTYKVRVTIPGYVPKSVNASVGMGVAEELLEICVERPVAQHTITIRLDMENRRVEVSPDPQYIRPGDSVVWFSPDSCPWTVHFSPISPLSDRRILSRGRGAWGGTVRADVAPGKYSYFVAVAVDGEWVFTADPELIDENEEEKGGGEG